MTQNHKKTSSFFQILPHLTVKNHLPADKLLFFHVPNIQAQNCPLESRFLPHANLAKTQKIDALFWYIKTPIARQKSENTP